VSDFRLRWHVYTDLNRLIEAVANGIVSEAARAISATGKFLIVLAGGSTPRPIYARLVELDTPWNQWHIYFGDERCFSIGHPERNDTMAREVWLDKVSIPVNQVHVVPAELGPDAGAERYARELAGLGPFDLTLLGLGEDGHTASLFPGDPSGCEPDAADALAVHKAPRSPASRVSMSAARLTRSQSVQLIVTGEEKRATLTRLRDGADMPIRSVTPTNGIDLFIDSSASPPGVV
jgi:6-phosphogluconolactonase